MPEPQEVAAMAAAYATRTPAVEGLHHRDGIWFYEAPTPPVDHECSAWTSGWIGLTQYRRCACGGVELNRSGHWMDCNSERRGEEPTDAG